MPGGEADRSGQAVERVETDPIVRELLALGNQIKTITESRPTFVNKVAGMAATEKVISPTERFSVGYAQHLGESPRGQPHRPPEELIVQILTFEDRRVVKREEWRWEANLPGNRRGQKVVVAEPQNRAVLDKERWSFNEADMAQIRQIVAHVDDEATTDQVTDDTVPGDISTDGDD